MQASMGQYSMHAGDPAQPVQQSVVIARMRGFFLRVALPSPSDMGQCFSTMSKMFCSSNTVMSDTLTQGLFGAQSESANTSGVSFHNFAGKTEFHHQDTKAQINFAIFEKVIGAQASSLAFLCAVYTGVQARRRRSSHQS